MVKLFARLFDDNAKDIKKYSKVLAQINELEPQIQALSDAALAAKTEEFRARLQKGETEQQLLPEAFAVVREAGKRVLNMRHFDVQMLGGMALFDGRIAEMRTGEGKTLVATLPAYLHALSGKGVHVITVNDYLASRDSHWMGRLYNFLGLSVGLVVHGLNAPERRAAYGADITYGTNNEFGFDYLRDNMAVMPDQMVQRPLHYALVDEVDSILIDEARTPLIISGPSDKPADLYYQVAKLIPRLRAEVDYTIDEKVKSAALTEEGVAKMERLLGVENLYDDKNIELSHHVNQALRAHTLYQRDREYVVRDGQVIIVDEFTGRLMFGRRYSEGLHQAIEAKEGVKIERESQTLATITFQNYFRMYEKLAGMTGTAKTEEEEFRKIYGFDVVEIPTNLPMIRQDLPDKVYRTEKGKFAAVVEEIVRLHAEGRPILVGTVSIEKSELLSKLLKQRGIPHQVLNAKFHEQEAQIISQAGRLGMVTIATNMAGRGTDIILGGNYQVLAEEEIAKREAALQAKEQNKEQEKEQNQEATLSPLERQQILEKYKAETAAEHQQVVNLGGLYIIGTERHESRRIDNQLRGRAGRQGDPGTTCFYLSAEDDLVRVFAGDAMASILDKFGMDDSVPIDSPLLSKTIENAQKKVEYRHFEMRKNVLDYDDVMNTQREIIYGERRRALYGENLRESVLGMIDSVMERIVAQFSGVSKFPEEWDIPQLLEALHPYFETNLPTEEEICRCAGDEVAPMLAERLKQNYRQRVESMGEEVLSQLERIAILKVVDLKWMDHLDAMVQLRQGIGLRAYGQTNPLVEYKYEAHSMFQEMVNEIQNDVVRLCLRANLVAPPPERRAMTENRSDGTPAKKQPVRKSAAEKVGRNDPCPCGSGKKYKNCCGRNQE